VPVPVPVPSGVWQGCDAWLRAQAAAGTFSGTALVAQDGRILLDAGYGLADRATAAPDTSQTTYCIASIGKLSTAVAIAQFVQRHRLSFDATIGEYLHGSAPAVAGTVTIGDLLDMTVGLGDVAPGQPDPSTMLNGMLKLIETEPLQEKPGARSFTATTAASRSARSSRPSPGRATTATSPNTYSPRPA
jgi:CubicO group peptidase (beta-lactamase class C family)